MQSKIGIFYKTKCEFINFLKLKNSLSKKCKINLYEITNCFSEKLLKNDNDIIILPSFYFPHNYLRELIKKLDKKYSIDFSRSNVHKKQLILTACSNANLHQVYNKFDNTSVVDVVHHHNQSIFFAIQKCIKVKNYQDIVLSTYIKSLKEAQLDELTQTYNRKYIRLNKEKICVNAYYLMIDINNFKKVNDKYGHLIGDTVLSFVAQNIKKVIRNNDIIIRYGGDEFIVIMNDDITKKNANSIINRIKQAIESENNIIEEKITISIGLSKSTQNININQAITQADNAMYIYKNSQSNR